MERTYHRRARRKGQEEEGPGAGRRTRVERGRVASPYRRGCCSPSENDGEASLHLEVQRPRLDRHAARIARHIEVELLLGSLPEVVDRRLDALGLPRARRRVPELDAEIA